MTTTFKPYPKYKPSGVEWLGDIPEHWEVKPLRSLCKFSKGLSITKADLRSEGIHCVNYGEIHSKYGVKLNPEIHPLKCVDSDFETTHPEALIQEGEFVFADTSEDLEGSGNFTHLVKGSPIFAGYHTVIARPTKGISPLFLAYQFDSTDFRSQIQKQVKGIKVFSITQGILKSVSCWLPNSDEQTAIANFLDSETAKIDGTLKELAASIELLNEEKLSLINEYVTGKINPVTGRPYPKYKPSGVEWLGDIPEHWDVMRSKRVLSERNERSQTGLEEMLSVSHLTGVTRRSEKDVNMFEAETNEGYKLCSKDNLAVNTLWAWMGAMGVAKEDGIVSPAYHVYWIATSMSPSYVDALVRLPNFVAEITRYSKGVWSSRLRLYPEGLFEAWLPLPPRKEQEAIMEAVASRTTQIEVLICEKQSLVETLKEYRTSLIHEAVTGKIDLRKATT